MMKTLNHRDIHPGDYVLADIFYSTDSEPSFGETIVKADVVTPDWLGVREGSGMTKYSWCLIHPIPLTKENLDKFNLDLVSGEGEEDDCFTFAKGPVTIVSEFHEFHEEDSYTINTLSPRVYFDGGSLFGQDASYKDVSYLHEVQQFVYEQSAGTYDFDLKYTPFKNFPDNLNTASK